MRGWRALAMLALSACLACSSEVPERAEPQLALVWTRAWGTEGDDFARALALDDAGNATAIGYSNGALPAASNAGAWDAFAAGFDGDGRERWTSEWGSAGPEFAQGVALDDAAVLVAGYSPGDGRDFVSLGGHDAFVSKLDADGALAWTARFGTDADDYVYGAARSPEGLVVAGYTKGAFEGSSNAGAADAFVALCDEAGAPRWVRQWGTQGTDYAQAVHVDAAGDIVVVGYTDGRLGEDEDRGAEDVFAVKLTTGGEQLWLRQWGSDTTDYGLSVTTDAARDVYVTGYSYGAMGDEPSLGGEDAYLSKLSAEGALVWTRQFGTPQRDSARHVSSDVSRLGVWLGGDTEGDLTGEGAGGRRDAFLVRFDDAGRRSSAVQWGGSGSEFVLSTAAAGSAVYVAGYTESPEQARDVLLSKFAVH